MNHQRLVIRQADNGWTMEGIDLYEVFGGCDCSSEVDAFAELLGSLNEHLGPQTTRHAKKRIYIVIHPGDKHDDFTNEIL